MLGSYLTVFLKFDVILILLSLSELLSKMIWDKSNIEFSTSAIREKVRRQSHLLREEAKLKKLSEVDQAKLKEEKRLKSLAYRQKKSAERKAAIQTKAEEKAAKAEAKASKKQNSLKYVEDSGSDSQ